MKKVSVIVPVLNECRTITKVLRSLKRLKIKGVKFEIVVVDDGSSDGTAAIIRKTKGIKKVFHGVNRGKGSAIKSGIKMAKGEVLVIQDADLEYDPTQIGNLIWPILNGYAEVVYGSRFMSPEPHRVLYFWHYLANKLITTVSNIFTNLNLSDVETGYKAFTRNVGNKLRLEQKGFGFEIEFTAKIAALKVPVYEIGISYYGRTYEEGKKITWKDGIVAIWLVFRYNLAR